MYLWVLLGRASGHFEAGGFQTELYSDSDGEAGCLQQSFGDRILVGKSDAIIT